MKKIICKFYKTLKAAKAAVRYKTTKKDNYVILKNSQGYFVVNEKQLKGEAGQFVRQN